MTRAVQPLAQFESRMPEHGRIRYGIKTERGAPKAIDTFRFTSSDRASLEILAEKYQGTVRPWSPGRGGEQYEVLTAASEIDVVIPRNALGDTPVYELWSGGGLMRRCDGERCFAPVSTRDGVELAEQPCVCKAKQQVQCKPITRVNVLIPDVPFNGTWRLEAKGWNAAKELPGMVQMVGELGEGGALTRATLALEKRTSIQGGQTRHFVVPTVRMAVTLNEILDGGASLQALGAGTGQPPAAAIESGDDEVVDAEVVDDDPFQDETREIHRLVYELDLSSADVEGFCYVVSDGAETSLNVLDLAELRRVRRVLERIDAGEVEYRGLEGRRAVVGRREESA